MGNSRFGQSSAYFILDGAEHLNESLRPRMRIRNSEYRIPDLNGQPFTPRPIKTREFCTQNSRVDQRTTVRRPREDKSKRR